MFIVLKHLWAFSFYWSYTHLLTNPVKSKERTGSCSFTLAYLYWFSFSVTSLDALNHVCKASHLFGQYFIAPSLVLQRSKAWGLVSLAGMGTLLKYISWDERFALNCFTAASVSWSPVIFLTSERIWVKKKRHGFKCFSCSFCSMVLKKVAPIWIKFRAKTYNENEQHQVTTSSYTQVNRIKKMAIGDDHTYSATTARVVPEEIHGKY